MPHKAFADLFGNYSNTVHNFETFHNQIINMPRANFSEIEETIKLIKNLSAYILLIGKEKLSESINYKTIYEEIYKNFQKGIVPEDKNRNFNFERDYLDLKESFDFLYSDEGKKGRMFRHYMQYFSFFQFFKNHGSRVQKEIDVEALEELFLIPNDAVLDNFRNRILNFNIKNNDFISNNKGIDINENADYRPAQAILRYLYEIKRPATLFEISILFGRIGDIQIENEIIVKALSISSIMPVNKEEQQKFVFGKMRWKNKSGYFQYSQSQNPDFKFKVFILFMNSLGLVSFDNGTSTMVLTEYTKQLMDEDIPIEVIDLQNLISRIDDETEDYTKLLDLILRKRTETITEAIKKDGELVYKMNKRNIKNPIIKRGKRVRNRVITELAKIKADYTDEVSGGKTFIGKNGMNYVEAHHIIEFNGENGPDITDNLICLGPLNHVLIHRGSSTTVQDFYRTTQTRGVITFNRFRDICVKYQCLTKEHVNILYTKSLISKIDVEELKKLIDIYGVDPDFLSSLSIEAQPDEVIT